MVNPSTAGSLLALRQFIFWINISEHSMHYIVMYSPSSDLMQVLIIRFTQQIIVTYREVIQDDGV